MFAMSPTTIYHNPQCSTSRKALALLREHGQEPQIIEYLQTPPDRATLQALIAASGRPVSDFVRRKETLFDELHLGAEGVTDADRLDALAAHPRLLERPIVVTELGTRLGRPLESVLGILPPAA
jgi:arsenate reductase